MEPTSWPVVDPLPWGWRVFESGLVRALTAGSHGTRERGSWNAGSASCLLARRGRVLCRALARSLAQATPVGDSAGGRFQARATAMSGHRLFAGAPGDVSSVILAMERILQSVEEASRPSRRDFRERGKRSVGASTAGTNSTSGRASRGEPRPPSTDPFSLGVLRSSSVAVVRP